MNKSLAARFGEGYQAAMRDMANSLNQGGITELLEWGTNNTNDPDAQCIFRRELQGKSRIAAT